MTAKKIHANTIKEGVKRDILEMRKSDHRSTKNIKKAKRTIKKTKRRKARRRRNQPKSTNTNIKRWVPPLAICC